MDLVSLQELETDDSHQEGFFLIISSYMVLKTSAPFFLLLFTELLLVFFFKTLLFIFDFTGSSLLQVGCSLVAVRWLLWKRLL